MRFKDGKAKVLTLSYDDGAIQDIRLINLMKKYGLKGTFNINTGWYSAEGIEENMKNHRLKLSDAKKLYMNSDNEIAIHTFSHPHLDMLRLKYFKHYSLYILCFASTIKYL